VGWWRIIDNLCIEGETGKSASLRKILLKYGQKHSNTGQIADGYACMAYNHFLSGDYSSQLSL